MDTLGNWTVRRQLRSLYAVVKRYETRGMSPPAGWPFVTAHASSNAVRLSRLVESIYANFIRTSVDCQLQLKTLGFCSPNPDGWSCRFQSKADKKYATDSNGHMLSDFSPNSEIGSYFDLTHVAFFLFFFFFFLLLFFLSVGMWFNYLQKIDLRVYIHRVQVLQHGSGRLPHKRHLVGSYLHAQTLSSCSQTALVMGSDTVHQKSKSRK